MKPSVLIAWALVMAVLLVLYAVDCKEESERRIFKRSATSKKQTSGGGGCTYRFRCKKKVRGVRNFLYCK